jgi:hypothetical protein
MQYQTKSIRPFIGAKNFEVSRSFYTDLGFTETTLGNNMSVFEMGEISFYLQDAFVKDWIDNTMIFLEVENVTTFWEQLLSLNLTTKYSDIKLSPIVTNDWGKECFIHDPSGILWHVGEFLA